MSQKKKKKQKEKKQIPKKHERKCRVKEYQGKYQAAKNYIRTFFVCNKNEREELKFDNVEEKFTFLSNQLF